MNVQGMTREQLSALRENAQRILRKSPSDAAAAQVLKAVDKELQNRFSGPDHGWSNGRQGEPRFFREEGQVVATVIRLETHGVNRGGYLIEVRGQPLPEHPRFIDEARRQAEVALGLQTPPWR
jgi:transposase